MKIKFLTFNKGHLVSDKEFDRLQKGFAKVGMELIREGDDFDILLVKGFSHNWNDVKDIKKPIVYYSIGMENTKESSESMRELYLNANAVVHISDYCKTRTEEYFGKRENVFTIIPGCEPNLPNQYPVLDKRHLKLATTCIPRPIKRTEETERLCKKFDIDLVPAYGNVSDFSYYHQCDGYIHLSRKEGMPNTVLEALSYGLPCIVTNYGGAKEAIGDAGIVIKNDPEDIMFDINNIEPIDDYLFEQAIKEFTNRLSELRIKVRERVLSQLNDKIMATKFKQVFESLL